MNFRRGGFWFLSLGYALTLGACVGVSSEVGSMNPEGGGGQGNECDPGDQKPAGDGCNTCSCTDDGNWACTEIGCGECTDGAMRSAGDGCNECVCMEGTWACTQEDCATCTVGDMRPSDCGSCWCADNGDGPTWNCTAIYCPPECIAGDTKQAGDGCNTCSCTDEGTWICTKLECPTTCTPGETKPAGDDCNTCTCFDGQWGCTMKYCGDPGVCDAGLADCNGDPADGCETNIESDASSCGACGNVCNVSGGAAACEDGQCTVGECQPGYADCNGAPEDGCEAPVGDGGCVGRCDVSGMFPEEPVPATGDCECPAGTVCVRGSVEDQDPGSEYCYPIPDGCADGFASCACMEICACPGNADATCYDEMAPGGVFIVNCPGFPAAE